MTTDIMGYNRKLVGLNGELYKYGDKLFGVYLTSKRIAKKVAKIEGAIMRQNGDYETTFSVPQNQLKDLTKVLGIKKLDDFKRD